MFWKTIEHPGYLGKKRDELFALWNQKYCDEYWRLGWEWGERVVSKDFAVQIYEDAYYEFFKKNKETLEWVLTKKDVWDTAISNINSGIDYNIQETPNTHIHDIAIRRAILRLGVWFRGEDLLEVRWKKSEGYSINPGVVPFHLPYLIQKGDPKDYGNKGIWWNKNTIEDFYQRNKVLQIKMPDFVDDMHGNVFW
jgi:hypothetical protein